MCFSGRESKTTQIYLLIDGLDFYPRVLLGDDRQLDPDVATLPSPKEALLSNSLFTLNYFGNYFLFYLIQHWKYGAICAVPRASKVHCSINGLENSSSPEYSKVQHLFGIAVGLFLVGGGLFSVTGGLGKSPPPIEKSPPPIEKSPTLTQKSPTLTEKVQLEKKSSSNNKKFYSNEKKYLCPY